MSRCPPSVVSGSRRRVLVPLLVQVPGWGNGVAPKWIPLPPTALNNDGNPVAAPPAVTAALGSYELRLEYVCLAAAGCPGQLLELRWAAFSTTAFDGGNASFSPIPAAATSPTQSDPELSRRALRRRLETGWGTFDHTSSLSWVLLPESLVVGVALYSRPTGALIGPTGLTVYSVGMTTAAPSIDFIGGFVLRLGMHSVDQSFAEAWLSWRGVNVSVAATVDSSDRSQLTLVATVVGEAGGAAAEDIALLLVPRFSNGRAGSVSVDGARLTGVGAGLRTSTLTALQGRPFRLPAVPVNASVALPAVYLGATLNASAPVVFSTAAAVSPAAVVAKTEAYRAAERRRLAKYGEAWADVKDAVQTSLMWSLMYDPKLSMLAPSYAYAPGTEQSPNPLDGDIWAGQFEWDQAFAAYMLGIDAPELALSQIIALIKMKTAAGFVPGFSSGTFKMRQASQPPIVAKALYEIATRWGVNRTRWALELCFDDLLVWNTWMFTQRREAPLGLLSYGESAYCAYAPDGTTAACHPAAGAPGSGLDNGPTVEGVPFNLTGLDLQDQYDAGFTGMYLMDTKAQLGIARMLGRSAAAAALRNRFDEVNSAMLKTLWNESEGVFQNCLSSPLRPITRLAPTHFYPLLAGPDLGGPSEALVATTVRRALTNNSKMAVWPSAAPPAGLPPVYARPLVQWYAKVCDSRGDGCPNGPHALCCQLDCNFRYAYGNMVQRAHAKVRFEGMALSRLDASTARIGGVTPVPLFEYNCSANASKVDLTIGPRGWAPGRGEGPRCTPVGGARCWALGLRAAGPGRAGRGLFGGADRVVPPWRPLRCGERSWHGRRAGKGLPQGDVARVRVATAGVGARGFSVRAAVAVQGR